MNIKIKLEGKWRVKGQLKNYVVGQVLEVGVDVPDHIAEDMLRCDYADKMDGMPKIETKETLLNSVHIGKNETGETGPPGQKKKDKKKKKKNRS